MIAKILLIILFLLFLIILLTSSFLPKKISLTEQSIVYFIDKKIPTLSMDQIYVKFLPIVYKTLCTKFKRRSKKRKPKLCIPSQSISLEELNGKCQAHFNINIVANCFHILLMKLITSETIPEELKKDILVSFYLHVLRLNFPTEIFTENDFYDRQRKILHINQPSKPRLTKTEDAFTFNTSLFVSENTKLKDFSNTIYNVFLTNFNKDDLTNDLLKTFSVCN